MARHVSVRGVDIKLRRPWVAFVLSIVTLGIYYLYWYYVSNGDLNEYGETLDEPSNPVRVSAGLATLAVSVGWLLIIPPNGTRYTSSREGGMIRSQPTETASVARPALTRTGFDGSSRVSPYSFRSPLET